MKETGIFLKATYHLYLCLFHTHGPLLVTCLKCIIRHVIYSPEGSEDGYTKESA